MSAGRANSTIPCNDRNTLSEEEKSDGCTTDGESLLPLARWLANLPNVDFQQRQRQGHSALHKAAWGGHVQDFAGNYAADLAGMANTEQHSKAAKFLRDECSAAHADSCKVLGVSVGASHSEIRQAYLEKARTVENGVGSQCNPVHSLNLMPELHVSLDHNGGREQVKTSMEEIDDQSLFKARLIAVLLEYGDKGLELCNIKKKWSQVWPDTPFPDIERDSCSGKKKGLLIDYLQRNAGDVVNILKPDDSRGQIVVVPKRCTRAHVSKASFDS